MKRKIELNTRPKTIICDIDGVLLKHANEGLSEQLRQRPLEGTIEKITEWDSKGYNIILITGRRESQRAETINQLYSHGVFYDKLIMGVGGGDRILINDRKPNSVRDTAYSINLNRNEGVTNVKI
jgi:phosphoglycolate phosphatase-like HAD superfamily hydrolase